MGASIILVMGTKLTLSWILIFSQLFICPKAMQVVSWVKAPYAFKSQAVSKMEYIHIELYPRYRIGRTPLLS